MRIFTIVVSAIFIVIGVVAILDGDRTGWWVAGFFALCLLVGLFEHRLPRPWLRPEFRLVLTPEEVACEHRKRPREAIRWQDVVKIWCVPTGGGLYDPDAWILLEGERGGCSFPTDAEGIGGVWCELETRYPGFDFKPIIAGPALTARQLCWERKPGAGA